MKIKKTIYIQWGPKMTTLMRSYDYFNVVVKQIVKVYS